MRQRTMTGFHSLVAGLALMALNACAIPAEPNVEGHDYRQNHKIQVRVKNVSISVSLPEDSTRLTPGDERRFRKFLRAFVQRGRSPVTAETGHPERARNVLLANGLRGSEIVMHSGRAVRQGIVILTFSANDVVAPECGDWSTPMANTYDNKPHGNYGCAMQRNLAITAADPGDFITAQPLGGLPSPPPPSSGAGNETEN